MAIKDITLGQYFPAESFVHRLDARTKILGTIIFLVSLFCVKSFTGFVLSAAFILICVKISKVPFSFISRGLKPIVILIIFTALLNMFTVQGEILLHIGSFNITKEGLYRAGFMAIRLVLLIFGSSLLTLATKPIELTDGIEKLLSPLRYLRVPVHEIAMMMTIALRFIPTLLDETDKIMKAQTARGADFESGNLKDRSKALIPLLVPLFVSAFRIASDLAMAMEARCYRGGNGRTRMNCMKYGKNDLGAFFILVLYIAITIVLSHISLI